MSASRRQFLSAGAAVGLEVTRRDLQRAMGDQKKPWEVGKSFDKSAEITHLHPADATGHIDGIYDISAKVV